MYGIVEIEFFEVATMRRYILLLLVNAVACASVKQPPICCFPQQFETFMFISQGMVDVESGQLGYGYGFGNGTASTAFDGVNQLTFSREHSTSLTSIWPIPVTLDYINILDYKNNVQWRVYGDGSCDKLDVGLPLYQECIPGNASLVSEGILGQSGKVMRTYIFHDRIYLDPYEVTITVIYSDEKVGECIPVRMTMSQAYVFDSDKNVDLTVADIFDFSPGIKDPAVFNPPSSCDNVTKTKNFEMFQHPGKLLETVKIFSDRLKYTDTN